MERALPIEVDEAAIADFCRRHHIRRLALFGSVLRDDFSEDSDIDVLVEFEVGHTPGFFAFSDMGVELESIIGRRVDLLTPVELSPYYRSDVVAASRVIYDAA